jgi:uncharacterized protein YbaP (TraB family)
MPLRIELDCKTLKKLTLIIISIFYYLIISVPAFALEQGLLWQIEAPNGAKSTIFGTMHLIDKDMNRVFNLIAYYVKRSRFVFIEYTLDDTDSIYITNNLINTKTPIKSKLSAQELIKLEKFFSEYHIPFKLLKKSSPSLIYGYLINPGSLNDLQIDFKIADLAKEQNIPVKGLENSRDVFERMLRLDNSFFILALKNALLNIDLLPSYRKKMKSLYFNEDLNGILLSLNEKEINEEANKAFLNTLINERNINMFHAAQAELNKGNAFIAIGAAHLAGEKGLLNLLSNAGYKITRLNFLSSK